MLNKSFHEIFCRHFFPSPLRQVACAEFDGTLYLVNHIFIWYSYIMFNQKMTNKGCVCLLAEMFTYSDKHD